MSKGSVDRLSMLLSKLGLANRSAMHLSPLNFGGLGVGRTDFQFEVKATGTRR